MRNDQLQALDVLLGDWDVTLSGAWLLDSLETEQHGTATFAWLGDAFVVMTSVMEGEPTWDFASVVGTRPTRSTRCTTTSGV